MLAATQSQGTEKIDRRTWAELYKYAHYFAVRKLRFIVTADPAVEIDDLMQDLLLFGIRAWERYSTDTPLLRKNKALKAIRNRAWALINYHTAEKRARLVNEREATTMSLDTPLQDSNQTVMHLFGYQDQTFYQVDWQMAVQKLLPHLSPQARRVFEGFLNPQKTEHLKAAYSQQAWEQRLLRDLLQREGLTVQQIRKEILQAWAYVRGRLTESAHA